MAKSKAKKQRMHKVRNGLAVERPNPLVTDFSTHVRKTPTLATRKEKAHIRQRNKGYSELHSA